MPVRSLTSSVLRWPGREEVHRAIEGWASNVGARQDVLHVGYFGSYAKGSWGVGSDADLVVVVDTSPEPFHRRSLAYDVSELPVPADVLVYTAEEWGSLTAAGRDPLGPVEWVFSR